MDDGQFIRHLQKTGQIEWAVVGSEGYFTVAGKPFILHQWSPGGAWALVAKPFFMGIKVFEGGLAREWPRLDWYALEAEGRRLSDKFRDSPYEQ